MARLVIGGDVATELDHDMVKMTNLEIRLLEQQLQSEARRGGKLAEKAKVKLRRLEEAKRARRESGIRNAYIDC